MLIRIRYVGFDGIKKMTSKIPEQAPFRKKVGHLAVPGDAPRLLLTRPAGVRVELGQILHGHSLDLRLSSLRLPPASGRLLQEVLGHGLHHHVHLLLELGAGGRLFASRSLLLLDYLGGSLLDLLPSFPASCGLSHRLLFNSFFFLLTLLDLLAPGSLYRGHDILHLSFFDDLHPSSSRLGRSLGLGNRFFYNLLFFGGRFDSGLQTGDNHRLGGLGVHLDAHVGGFLQQILLQHGGIVLLNLFFYNFFNHFNGFFDNSFWLALGITFLRLLSVLHYNILNHNIFLLSGRGDILILNILDVKLGNDGVGAVPAPAGLGGAGGSLGGAAAGRLAGAGGLARARLGLRYLQERGQEHE